MRLGPELLALLLADVKERQKVIFLTDTAETAEKAAARFVRAMGDEGQTIQPSKNNPCFLRVPKGPWVLFHATADLDSEDDVGAADIVYWPTEGLDYERVAYADWKPLRRASVWRPLHVRVEEERDPNAPATAYDHLLD